jgi:hypothetical protein
MKTKLFSKTHFMKSLVEESEINGLRRERRRGLIFTIFVLKK